MQNDRQQMSLKTTVENDGENNAELVCETIEASGVTQPDPSANQPDVDKHNTATNLRKNRKKGKKSKPKPPAQNPANELRMWILLMVLLTPVVLNQRDEAGKRLLLQGTRLLETLSVQKWVHADDPDHYYIVKPFPGATVSDMEDFVKLLTRRSPDKMILHVGTNDLRNNSSPKIIADSIVNIVTQIKEDSPGTAFGISAILVRNDNNELAAKAIQTDNILKGYCSRNTLIESPF